MEQIKYLLIKNHLFEIKYRLYYLFISLIFTFIICLIYFKEIFYILTSIVIKLNEISAQHFIYTNINEMFFAYINNSIIIAIIVSIPILYIHIWFFFIPGLYKFERKLLNILIIFSIIMYLFSIIIVYNILIPMTWNFFLGLEFNSPILMVKFEPKISEYLYMMALTTFLFIISFQLPIIFFILILKKIISIKFLIIKRHYGVLYSLIIAALLSPPDVISQITLAIPLIISYELIIFIILLLKDES